MNPIVRVLGRVLSLVGISSPEDNRPKPKDTSVPSWRDRPAPGSAPDAAKKQD
ncbi:MAG TPA: hypothetical protein VGC07_01545 [Granulicella sp.]